LTADSRAKLDNVTTSMMHIPNLLHGKQYLGN